MHCANPHSYGVALHMETNDGRKTNVQLDCRYLNDIYSFALAKLGIFSRRHTHATNFFYRFGTVFLHVFDENFNGNGMQNCVRSGRCVKGVFCAQGFRLHNRSYG